MRQFKTESKKLLDLMINSIYTNKEIFLRELISNASDAVDKLNFKSLQDPSVKLDQGDLAIRVSFDKDARTITISDNGIGMTAEELERNLGTIAHSGSEEFKTENAEQQGSDVDIIGQFGVGFYSAFMVASHVKVVSRAYGEDTAHVWESDGLEGYTIEDGERAEHGTDVILTLRENEKLDADGEAETYDRFLTEWGLKSLIRQYSNYVRYPIQMMVSKSRQKPKPEDAGDDYKPEYEDYQELETINSMTPIWKKRSSDVEQKDYNEFYKSTFHDFDDPARTISFHAEGTLEYDALLFVPGRAPFDLYSKDYEKGLALYSSNVLIMEKCDDLLPDYYNFVRGVVDSADVSLNISRETLQQNRQLKAIAKRVEKKITADLEDMRDNEKAVADGAEPEVEDRHLELKNVATGDLDLATEDEKKEAEDATKENEDLFNAMKEALGDKVEKVAVSARLTDAPACITTEGPLSLEMEKVLQKGPEGAPDGMPKSQRVLELNANHPVFDKLVAAQKAGDADKIKQYSGLLYDQALLVEGILPEDPVAFAAAVCELM